MTAPQTEREAMNLRLAVASMLLLCPWALAADTPAIQVDKDKKTVTIPAKVAPRKLPNLDQIYPIEVVACWGADHDPKGQKAHETVVVFDAKPSDIHKALESLGLKPGKPAKGEDAKAEGPEVKVYLEVPEAGAVDNRRIPIEKTLVDKRTGKTMPALKWYFTGSAMKQLDPTKPEMTYAADTTGTLIGIFPVTDEVVIQTNLTMKEEPLLKMETNKKVLPEEGKPVKIVIEVPAK
jgi:hypothetical protein